VLADKAGFNNTLFECRLRVSDRSVIDLADEKFYLEITPLPTLSLKLSLNGVIEHNNFAD
jgi:hypothetical protein